MKYGKDREAHLDKQKAKLRSAIVQNRNNAAALPTFMSQRNSVANEDSDDSDHPKVRPIDKLKDFGGILGLEKQKEKEKREKEMKAQKAKQFSDNVKEVYKPRVNAKKAAEMMSLKEKAMKENHALRQPKPYHNYSDKPW